MKNSFLKIIFALIFFLPFWPSVVFAGAEHNISGWAWSSTIGWISFNCTNDSSCATSNYGVHKNLDGTFIGHAWSSNIGWIQFGGLSEFPTGGGTQAQNANISGNNLHGWARACAGTATGDCSTMISRTDGWDGWLSLSGTGYGVTRSGDNFTGFAWGSNIVGWVNRSAGAGTGGGGGGGGGGGEGEGAESNFIGIGTGRILCGDPRQCVCPKVGESQSCKMARIAPCQSMKQRQSAQRRPRGDDDADLARLHTQPRFESLVIGELQLAV